jgi:hypothetical protein
MRLDKIASFEENALPEVNVELSDVLEQIKNRTKYFIRSILISNYKDHLPANIQKVLDLFAKDIELGVENAHFLMELSREVDDNITYVFTRILLAFSSAEKEIPISRSLQEEAFAIIEKYSKKKSE